MEPTPRLGDYFDIYANETFLHPLVLAALVFLCLLAFAADRRRIAGLLLVAQALIPWGQRASILGLDFTVMRVLLCAVSLRVVIRREYASFRATRLDRILILYAVASSAAYYLQAPSAASAVNSMGNALDSIGAYFVIRLVVRDKEDLLAVCSTLMWLSFAVAVLFAFESRTGDNPFGFLGGVAEHPEIRLGRLRAQGAYAHPIIAGAVWAAVYPLQAGVLAVSGRRKALARLSSACCAAIVLMSASSTPLLSLFAAMALGVLYYQRASLSDFMLASLAALVALAALMDNPIWFIFTKLDLTGGSTGYHRYLLIDQFVNNWRDWVLIGIRDSFHWGFSGRIAYVGLDDVTNQFIAEGIRGGVVGLGCFVAAIGVALSYVKARVDSASREDERRMYWSLGVSLLTHVCSFFGVSYFAQVKFSWWMTLAICASLYRPSPSAAPEKAPRLLLGEKA